MSMKFEVKVNDGGFLIDATMEVKDGVILITPVKALSEEEEGKWTPKDYDEFFMPCYFLAEEAKTLFSPASFKYDPAVYTDIKKWDEYKRGWIFKTKEECQSLCDKLNAAIVTVTP